MIIENKKTNIHEFYDTHNYQLNNLFLTLLNRLKLLNIQIYNKNQFYREYIMYAYQHSAHI